MLMKSINQDGGYEQQVQDLEVLFHNVGRLQQKVEAKLDQNLRGTAEFDELETLVGTEL
jgi:hypothetical protein